MTRRRTFHVVAYLLLLAVTAFLALMYFQSRALQASLQEKLDSSLQERKRTQGELSLVQQRFHELGTASRAPALDSEEARKRSLRQEIQSLGQQIKQKDAAYSALQERLKSLQQMSARAAQRTENIATEDEAARQERQAKDELAIRHMKEVTRYSDQYQLKMIASARDMARKSADPEEREHLLRTADVLEQLEGLNEELNAAHGNKVEQQRILDQQNKLKEPFRALAKEEVRFRLRRIGERFQVSPERMEEFVDATSRAIGEPLEDFRLLGIGTSLFTLPGANFRE